MQYLITFSHFNLAARFRDYIHLKYNTEIIIETADKAFKLYLDENNPNFDLIKHELNDYMHNYAADKYIASSWSNTEQPKITNKIGLADFKDKLDLGLLRKYLQTPFTLLIFVTCTIIYFLSIINLNLTYSIFNFMHFPMNAEQKFQLWRYFSHALVHLSLLHYLFNLVWWMLFAYLIEKNLGTYKIFQLFLVSAVTSGIAQYLASDGLFFGLSGVVYCILGFVFIIDKFIPNNQPKILPAGFSTFIIISIILGFFGEFIGVAIGNAAHIAGLFTGIIICLWDCRKLIRKN